MDLTIINSLFLYAQKQPDQIAFRYLQDIENPPQELSYKDLWLDARAIAKFLLELNSPGDRVMLFFPPGLAYVKAFFGCLLAGMVAVPLYPPRRNVKSDRIIKVAESCQASIALTTQSEIANIQASWDEQNTLGFALMFYATDNIFSATQAIGDCPSVVSNTPAFLQYTSGSTGTPKGVVITHQNIVANAMHLALMSNGSRSDVFVNWLPLFHDMGLMITVLWPVYLGASSTLMAPATFVRNPVVWFKAISLYRGTLCGAPNFAYDLCTDKISDEDLLGIDLSSWRLAYNAAEPIRAETLNNFTARFSGYGFGSETFYPCYGMAEATVFITGGNSLHKPIQITVNKKLIAEHKLELVDKNDPSAMNVVACGSALAPHDVRIVDPEKRIELSDGCVGEIWFAGPSVSPGYWQLAELNSITFDQKPVGAESNYRYLRTGDLGFMWKNELFVTGRIKDLIILHGKNYYPQDIEMSASIAHRSIRRGHCATFSVVNNNAESLVVVAEIEREYFRSLDSAEVISAIRHRVAADHEVNVDHVVLLKPYKIPVTSSGKIQRRQTKQLFLGGELDAIAQTTMARPIANYIAPSTEVECLLANIWCSVLELERVSTIDNFFDIGGTSLAALAISAKVKKEINFVDIDIEQLLRFPTIVELAQFLELKIAHKKNIKSPANVHPKRVIKI